MKLTKINLFKISYIYFAKIQWKERKKYVNTM